MGLLFAPAPPHGKRFAGVTLVRADWSCWLHRLPLHHNRGALYTLVGQLALGTLDHDLSGSSWFPAHKATTLAAFDLHTWRRLPHWALGTQTRSPMLHGLVHARGPFLRRCRLLRHRDTERDATRSTLNG